MKKLVAAVLLMGMTLSLAACGNTGADSNEAAGGANEADSQAADAEGAGAGDEESSQAAGEEGQSGDTFTVGFDQDFPPFGYVGDDGEFTGFDIEMATECAKRMGKEVVLQPIDWDSKDMEIGRAHV